MKKRIRLKGRIKTYLQFSIYLGVLLLVVNVGMLLIDYRAGLLLGFLLFFILQSVCPCIFITSRLL